MTEAHEWETTLRQRGSLVEALGSSVGHANQNMITAVRALERVINEDTWREFKPRGSTSVVRPASFTAFLTAPRFDGIDTTIEIVRNVVQGDTILTNRLDELLKTTRKR